MTKKGGNKFSQIPEWVIDADISDTAFRLYAVLLRYADYSTLEAYPARSTLAKRLKRGDRAVDRALKDLTRIGAVKVINRYEEGSSQRRSNKYIMATTSPHEVASKTTPPTVKNDATLPSKTTQGVASKTTHITIPTINDTHMNEASAAKADATNPSSTLEQGELIQVEKPKTPAKKKHPHQQATQNVYDQTGGAINFTNVMGIAKWLINDRGLTIDQATQAIVEVYEQGKPIMKQTLGQHIDGHHRNQKTGYNEWAAIGTKYHTILTQEGGTV